MAKMSALNEFKKLLAEANKLQNKEIKEVKESKETSISLTPQTNIQVNEEETIAQKTAKYLTKKSDDIPATPANIEKQRWDDPLRKSSTEKFITFKEMDDHYGLFLQRIQQQMSTMGGGGEVKFARLDDINSASVGLNKYLTYDQNTRKFYFDTVGISDGLYLNTDNEVTLSVASPTVLGGIKIGQAFEIDGSNALQIIVATNTDLGGVKLGPGVTVNDQDQIIIDSTGLDFSFGDFAATVGTYTSNTEYAILKAINDDEDVVIASNGIGSINVVGQFHVHPTNGSLTEILEEDGANY
jgi:hypothetical protein